ncbi:hypothetical protein QAD02_011514 [Eretmocerus hayati]|uniref:Uncharacterized protein n=1 Tax=Eretmocerus hayati TaxID=131215 RepID=A0ACC2NWZ2_9HYME|nr:hypothetical protein QAD02_011514 [Eretmocerus hayati]
MDPFLALMTVIAALIHFEQVYGNDSFFNHKDWPSFHVHQMLHMMGREMKNGQPHSRTCDSNPVNDMNVVEFIRHHGYPAEEHVIKTDDGYILTMHRIPGNKTSRVVLLQHPLIASSYVWVSSGKHKALAFLLADKGYDVWMGNVRGNTYSKNHTIYSELDKEFWNFSWHEMAIYDLPAEIQYITSMRKKRLTYVGHSMGTTVFFAMASERPDIAAKVEAMFALAPAVYNDALIGSLRLLEPLLRDLVANREHMDGKFEFLGNHPLVKYIGRCVCNRPGLREICETLIFSVIGYPPQQFNREFRHFNYGPQENLRLYNSRVPPKYDLSKIQVPIGLFYGDNDFISVPKNVARLYEEIPNKIGSIRVEHAHFNHIDFLWGIDAPKLVYRRLIELIDRYHH